MKDFFGNKLGISFDYSLTNKYADFPNVNRSLTDYETVMLEHQIDKIYNDFLGLVSAGRKMASADVDSVGQGRVWSGSDALELGLIDQFGGLQDAIKLAAEMAQVTEYNIWSLPAQKDPVQQIIDELTGNVSAVRMEKELGEYYQYYQYLKQIKEMNGIQARLPFEITIR
jgi:protease-4